MPDPLCLLLCAITAAALICATILISAITINRRKTNP
jgi:hypothetical protein